MRRALVVVAALGVVLLAPQDASAGFWSWLEGFSGPGPLRTRKGRPPILTTWCAQDGDVRPSPLAGGDAYHVRQWEAAALINKWVPDKKLSTPLIYKRLLADPTPAESFMIGRTETFAQLLQQLQVPPRVAPKPATSPDDATQQPRAPLETPVLPTTLGTAIDFYGRAKPASGDPPFDKDHPDKKLTCWYVDYARFVNDVGTDGLDLNGFPSVAAQLFDFGGVARLHDGIDFGAGIGFVRFSGEQVPEAFNRMTLTPFRSVIRPLLLVVPEEHRKRWMGLVSFHWKETYVVGPLNAAHFGAPVTNTYRIEWRAGPLVRRDARPDVLDTTAQEVTASVASILA